MKKNKKLLPLVALVATVAVLAAMLAALRLAAADDAETESGPALCSLDAGTVDKLAYTTDALDIALTKDAQGTWTLDSDPLLPLDQTKINTLAETLTGMTAQRELGAEADTAAMGFETPQMVFELAAGSERYTLTVGDQNTMTDSYYVRTNAGETVYTVAVTDLSGSCKAPADLYAPQDIITLESDAVTAMTVENGNETLHFTQQDGTWSLADDAGYALDQSIVTRMASTVCGLQSSWSITAPAADSAYGLGQPNVTVTLLGADGQTVQCRFGATDPEDDTKSYLASTETPDVVYEVSTDNLAAFAYTKATLQASTAETASDETANIVAEYPVGGADDYTDSTN